MSRLALSLLLLAVGPAAYATPTRIEIVRRTAEIRLDGDLSDPGWQGATRVESFVEYWKNDNSAAPAATLGLLLYDDQAVYVAFRAEDPQPGGIRAPFVDRDKVLGDQDYVAVLLDTQNDRRSAMAFRVNPRGVQTDSVVNDANESEDFAPDFFYEAVARTTDTGWTAEMRIPLSTLRYPAEEEQSWGVMLMRNYPRDYRYIMANTPVPKNSNCFLCHASTLTGLRDLPTGAHMTLAPYSTAQHRQQRRAGIMEEGRVESDAGLDWKWNVNPKLTIDTTLNPDFSQIESDVPRIDANSRFALDFPEKRTFFLEGVDLLSTPIRAVYTRSITSPAWGVRATGQNGSTAYTMLVTADRGGGFVVLPGREGSQLVRQDFRSHALIGRLRHSIGSSFAGLLVSAREVDGGGYNRLAGPDFLWKISDSDRLTGQLLYSTTENPQRPDLHPSFDGRTSGGHYGRLMFSRDRQGYDIWTNYYDHGKGWRADNGFTPFVGGRGLFNELGLRFYPKSSLSYLRLYLGTGVESTWNGILTGFYFRGKWNSEGYITWHHDQEKLRRQNFDLDFAQFSMRAAPWRHLPAIQLEGRLGQRLDAIDARIGRGGDIALSATTRPNDHLEVQVKSSREWLDLSGQRLFNAQIHWLKTTYSFNARTLLRLIAQNGDTTRQASRYSRPVDPRDGDSSLSALLGYRLNWQTVFFLGYGDSRLLDERNRLAPDARSLFMKVSYAFQR